MWFLGCSCNQLCKLDIQIHKTLIVVFEKDIGNNIKRDLQLTINIAKHLYFNEKTANVV